MRHTQPGRAARDDRLPRHRWSACQTYVRVAGLPMQYLPGLRPVRPGERRTAVPVARVGGGQPQPQQVLVQWSYLSVPLGVRWPQRELSGQDTRVGNWFESGLGHTTSCAHLRVSILIVDTFTLPQSLPGVESAPQRQALSLYRCVRYSLSLTCELPVSLRYGSYQILAPALLTHLAAAVATDSCER